jgi:hypothetical protein
MAIGNPILADRHQERKKSSGENPFPTGQVVSADGSDSGRQAFRLGNCLHFRNHAPVFVLSAFARGKHHAICSGDSGKLDKNIIPFQLYGKPLMLKICIQAMPPRGDIELPAVPGAGHDVSPKDPITERPARVRANAVQGVKRAIHVKERHHPPARSQFLPRALGDILDTGDTHPFAHAVLLRRSSQ